MRLLSAYCWFSLLLFIVGLNSGLAQNIASNSQERVTVASVVHAAISGSVNAQVRSSLNQYSGSGGTYSHHSVDDHDAFQVKGFGAMRTKPNRSFSGEKTQIALRMDSGFSPLSGGRISATEQEVNSADRGKFNSSRQDFSVALSTQDSGATTSQSVAIGEFPDSTREIVWPSPPFNAGDNIFRFHHAVSGKEPNFDNSVQLRYFYGKKMKVVNVIGSNSSFPPRSRSTGSLFNSTGLRSAPITGDQMTNGLIGSQPTNSLLQDPLTSGFPQQ